MKKNKNIAQTIGIGVAALLLIGLTAGVISSLNDVNDNIIQSSNNKCNEITYSSNAIVYEFEDSYETALCDPELSSNFDKAVESGHNLDTQDFSFLDYSNYNIMVDGDLVEGTFNVSVVLSTEDYETFSNRGIFKILNDADEIIEEIAFKDINYDYQMNNCDHSLFCFKKIDLGVFDLEANYYSFIIEYLGSEGPDDIVPDCPLVLLDSLIFEPTNSVKAKSNYKDDSKESDIVNYEEDPLGYLPWGPLV